MKYMMPVFLFFSLIAFQATPVVAESGGSQTQNQCNDKSDNDGDGLIDTFGTTILGKQIAADPECAQNKNAVCETGEETGPCKKVSSPSSGSGSGGGAMSTNTGPAISVKIDNPLKVDTIQGAIRLFMSAVLRVALPFIVVFFIWSGFSFILARGNPEKIKTAKNMFLYTIVGTLLILGAWVITNAIIGTVNSITS